jgi:NADPH:quinone reductase-like Zn-dependent oxidoreductase
VIGHDISGVIEAVGADVTEFAPGDEVYYTPKIFGGAASYAEVHVADVDLVGRKPGNISHVEAASLTLVGGTVWEAFVIRAQLQVGETILIHGGAGGVGTVAIQVAKAIGARVVTTALARDHDFVRTLGADDAIDFTATDYVDAVNALTGERRVDVIAFKRKAVSIHHELMFTRSIYGKPDMAEQGRILNEASALVDAGRLRTTLTERLSPINAANLRRVHALLESGNARGKIVLEGFQSG